MKRLSLFGFLLLCIGILHIQAYNIMHISSGDGLSSSSVLTIEQQPNGTMLFGTVDGLNSYDGHNVWLTTFNVGERLYGNLIEHVLTVEENKTWVLTNYGLNIVTEKGRTVRFYPQFQGIRRIRKNPQNDGFILTDDKLNFIDKRDGSMHALPLKGVKITNVCDFAVTNNELLLFCSDGIVAYPLRTEKGLYAIGKPKKLQQIQLITAVPDGDRPGTAIQLQPDHTDDAL